MEYTSFILMSINGAWFLISHATMGLYRWHLISVTWMPYRTYAFDSNERFTAMNGGVTMETRIVNRMLPANSLWGHGMLTGIIFHRKSMRIRWVNHRKPWLIYRSRRRYFLRAAVKHRRGRSVTLCAMFLNCIVVIFWSDQNLVPDFFVIIMYNVSWQ